MTISIAWVFYCIVASLITGFFVGKVWEEERNAQFAAALVTLLSGTFVFVLIGLLLNSGGFGN